MRKAIVSAVFVLVTLGFVGQAVSAYYVEYYRDNLFLGLAYHRVGCLTNWSTIQANQDYDGFTNNRYCYSGATADSVPNASWYDWNYASGKSQLDACGTHTNNVYDTPNYASRSNSCSYNILFDCNSDCWISEFSSCQGYRVGTVSPCW
ncbi:hypothetical protein [Haliangium sp.]|uniref:hypothetical protein n=1 Tax=Haliangium sp. TaxID=2663208 RepID=UPI003D14EF9A